MPRNCSLKECPILFKHIFKNAGNNHINKYEIDDLPIIDIDLLSNEYLSIDSHEREKTICSLYGLNEFETEYIIAKQYDTI